MPTTDDFDPTKPLPAASTKAGDDFDPTKPLPGAEQGPNPVERRVREASHQVMEDFRQGYGAPKNVKEAVAQAGRRAAGPVGQIQTAMDIYNVPAAGFGGVVESLAGAGKGATPTTPAGLPKLPGWLETALDSINPALKPAVEAAIMKPKLAGDVAQAVAPGPEGVAAEAIGTATSLARATKLASEMKIPIAEARQLIAAGKVPAKFMPEGTRAEKEAARRVMKRVRVDTSGETAPTAQEMLEHADRLPRERLTIMDEAGDKTRGFAGMVARAPEGAGGGTVRRFFEGTQQRPDLGRTNQLGDELEAELHRTLGSGSSYRTVKALREHQMAESDPIYEDAFEANPVIRSSKIDQIVRDRHVKGLWEEAIKDVRSEVAGTDKPIPDKMSMRVLDRLKQRIYTASQYGDKTLQRSYTRLYKDLVKEMDTLDRSDGLYAKARGIYGDDARSMQAVKFGKEALLKGKKAMSSEEIQDKLSKLTPNDQEFARLGLADQISAELSEIDTSADAARRFALKKGLRNRLRPFFKSPKEADAFFDAAEAKHIQYKTHAEVIKGSPTAERRAADLSGDARAAGHVATSLAHAAHGHPGGALYHAGRAMEFMRRPHGAAGEEAAKILTERLNQPGTTSRKIVEQRALEQAALDLVKRNPPFLKRFDMTRGLGKGVPLAVQQGISAVSPQDQEEK